MKKYSVILDENKIIKVDSLKDCVEAIKEHYRYKDTICLGELLSSVEVQGFSICDVVEIYAQLIKDIENDYLEQGNVEEDYSWKIGV